MQPHASELEEAIIGACLIEQEALPLVADKLRPEMFYDDHHQLIFAALIAMYQANKKIDIPPTSSITRKSSTRNIWHAKP